MNRATRILVSLALAAIAAATASCGNAVMASDMDVPGTYVGTGRETLDTGASRMGPGSVAIMTVPAGYAVDLDIPFLTGPCRLQATRTTADAFAIATGQGCDGGYSPHEPGSGSVTVTGTTVSLAIHIVFNQGFQTTTFDFEGSR